jgi:O-antigen/teichoic acid export membrane protein
MSVAPAPMISDIYEAADVPGFGSGAGVRGSVVAAELVASGSLRAWGIKSAWSLLDQGLTALTGFCVTWLLARWLAAEIYGAYAIAFAGYLFVSGLHNVIVLEPMSVIGPSRYTTRLAEYFRSQTLVHGALVGILSAAVILVGWMVRLFAPESPLIGAIVASGLALPFLLFLFLARRMCYTMQRPLTAVLGSGTCFTLALAGLYALHHSRVVSPFSVFLLVGAASFAGSCLVVRQLGVSTFRGRPIGDDRIAWTSTLRENWSYGRWLVGSTLLYSISGQVQMVLAAAFLGLGAAGILRAMMLPASVMTQAVTAAGLLVLPGFSFDFGRGLYIRMRQKAVIVSSVLCAAGLCFAALLWLVAGRAEHLLFGGKYSGHAWLMPILALIPAANGFTMGYSTSLRASQRPYFDLLANAIAAPVAVVSAVIFIRWWGLAGAAMSLVTGFVVYMGINCVVFYAAPHSKQEIEVMVEGMRG